MKCRDIGKITKLYFGCDAIAAALGISASSARVTASRYTRQGLLVRIKRDTYVAADKWQRLAQEELYILANVIQVPSYVSLMTALSYHGVTTQVQRSFFESVNIKRTKTVAAGGVEFRFIRMQRGLYFGFRRENDFFIASAEKAFLDAYYLKSLGRYSFDLSSIDAGKLSPVALKKLAARFPLAMRKELVRDGYLTKA